MEGAIYGFPVTLLKPTPTPSNKPFCLSKQSLLGTHHHTHLKMESNLDLPTFAHTQCRLNEYGAFTVPKFGRRTSKVLEDHNLFSRLVQSRKATKQHLTYFPSNSTTKPSLCAPPNSLLVPFDHLHIHLAWSPEAHCEISSVAEEAVAPTTNDVQRLAQNEIKAKNTQPVIENELG